MKVPRAVVEARRESIARLLDLQGYLPVQDISNRFHISEATVRRDLVELAARRRLTRTRGGALTDFNLRFAPVDERRAQDAVAKQALGVVGAALIQPGSTIYIDAGSTPLAVAESLVTRGVQRLRVVTPSVAAAQVLSALPDVEVHIPGGVYLGRQQMVAGPRAAKALRGWKFDWSFVGAEGADAAGLHNSQDDIVAVAHALLEISEHVILCLTRSKIGCGGPVRVAPTLDGFHLLTDATRAELRRARVPLGNCRLLPL